MKWSGRCTTWALLAGAAGFLTFGWWLSTALLDGEIGPAALLMGVLWMPLAALVLVTRALWVRNYRELLAQGEEKKEAQRVAGWRSAPLLGSATLLYTAALWAVCGVLSLAMPLGPWRAALAEASGQGVSLLITIGVVWLTTWPLALIGANELRCARCDRVLPGLQALCPTCGAYLLQRRATRRGRKEKPRQLPILAAVALAIGIPAMALRVSPALQRPALQAAPERVVRSVALGGRAHVAPIAWESLERRARSIEQRDELGRFAINALDHPQRTAAPRAAGALLKRTLESDAFTDDFWRRLVPSVFDLSQRAISFDMDEQISAAAARSRDRADALVTHVAARFEANPMLRVRSGWDARAAALVAADHTGTEPALALIRSLMIEAEGAPPVIAHEYNSVARIALRSQSPEVRLAARRALLGWFMSSPLDNGIRLGAVAGVFDDAIVVGDLTAEEAVSLSAVLIPIAADDPSTLSFNLLSSLAEARLIPTELLNLLVTTLQGRVETQQQHSHAWSTLRVIGACTTDDRIRDRVVAVFVRAVAERQAPYSESGFYARAVAQRWTTPEQNLVLFLSAQSRGLFSESALRRHTAPGLHEAICQAAAAEPVKFAALHPNAWTWILNERREERLTPDQSRTIDEASATLEARRTERGRGSSP